jgi:hypothetical protein
MASCVATVLFYPLENIRTRR